MRVQVLPLVGWITRTAVAEVGWWLGGAWRFLRTAPRRAVGWLAGMLTGWWLDVWTITAGLVVVAAVPALWFRVWPGSYHRRVGVPLWRHRMIRSTRKGWVELMEAAGLSRHARTRDGSSVVQVPGLGRLRWESGDVLVGQPQLLRAQTVTDVTAVAERLRVDVGSRQIRIVPNTAMTGCEIRWLFTDPLATPILATVPELPVTLPRLDRLELGVTEDGDPFYRDLQVSMLVAGASGSGKAGDMWSVMCQLGPAIGCGLVQVHGIDLKGGAEQAMGPALFTRSATTPADAVQVLEEAVVGMLARAEAMAGRVRFHTPTVEEPLVLVLIDELAMLTGYLTDRDLSKRADAALRSLLALGRAPAYWCTGMCRTRARTPWRCGTCSTKPPPTGSENAKKQRWSFPTAWSRPASSRTRSPVTARACATRWTRTG